MCGTPVVSFETGVANDLIINDITGYTVPSKDTDKLAATLYKILSADIQKMKQMRKSCRNFAIKEFSFKASSQIINLILNEN